MNSIQFNQTNTTKALIFTLCYLLFVIIVLLLIFSPTEIFIYINEKMTFLETALFSIVLLFPILILRNYAADKAEFVLTNNSIKLIIKDQNIKIEIEQVDSMVFEDGPKKSLTFFTEKQAILLQILPVGTDEKQVQVIKQIIGETEQYITFTSTTKKVKTFGKSYEVFTYKK